MVQRSSIAAVLPLTSDDKQHILPVQPIRYSRVGELWDNTFILPGKVSLRISCGADTAVPTERRLMRINAGFPGGLGVLLVSAAVEERRNEARWRLTLSRRINLTPHWLLLLFLSFPLFLFCFSPPCSCSKSRWHSRSLSAHYGNTNNRKSLIDPCAKP